MQGIRRRVVTGLACLVGLAAPAAQAGAPVVMKGPYLQDLASTKVRVKVEIEPAAPATLEVTAKGGVGPPKVLADVEARAMHVFRVDGLEPGRTYDYALRIAGQKDSAGGTFTTAPGNDSTAPFTFAIYGDNRTDDAAHATVVRAMRGVPTDFLVHTGDFVEDGRDPRQWQGFFAIETPLLRDRCVFACVGNHELHENAGENFLRYFGPVDPVRLYGSFRWGNTRFLQLNGSDTFTDGPESAWLRDELSRADVEPGLVWRFIVVHHGPWSAGPHGSNTRLLAGDAEALFAAHKIDAVFSGHDHIYERGDYHGIRYVVTGGGGAPLYPIKAPLPSTKKMESTHHFVEVTVAGETVKLVTHRSDGSILERAAFGKTPGWASAAPTAAASAAVAVPSPPQTEPPPASAARCGCRIVGDSSANGTLTFLFGGLALLASSRRLGYSRVR